MGKSKKVTKKKSGQKQILIIKIVKSVFGGACIALGTYFSKMCQYPILAPVLFAVGIFLVMAFDFCLITREVPTSKNPFSWSTLVVLVVNLIVVWLLGLFVPQLSISPAPSLEIFGMSILGGIVIGLVSFNNLQDSPYKLVIAILLMYGFVMLGLPHCVVYAFLHVDFVTLLVVIAGNLIGGLFLNYSRRLLVLIQK